MKTVIFSIVAAAILVGCGDTRGSLQRECFGDTTVKCHDRRMKLEIAELGEFIDELENKRDKIEAGLGKKSYADLLKAMEEGREKIKENRPNWFMRTFMGDAAWERKSSIGFGPTAARELIKEIDLRIAQATFANYVADANKAIAPTERPSGNNAQLPQAQGGATVNSNNNSSLPASTPVPTPAAENTKDKTSSIFRTEAVIQDPDGYTNIRSSASGSGDILGRIVDGERFYTSEQQATWWKVRTQSGITGYVHKSRIKLSLVSVSQANCPTAHLLNELYIADAQCSATKSSDACPRFIDLFEELIPAHNCRRSFDSKPVPAIWLAGNGQLEQYVAHLSKMKSKNAVALFSSSKFRAILDGSLAEEYAPLSERAGR